jgi:AAA15 family ATPase/GTPase
MVYDKVKGIYFFHVDGKSFLEFGFGFTQIITILLKVCEVLTKYELYLIHYNKYSKTRGALVEMRMHMCPIYDVIILEEPETNLHPNYQSLLAELIAECRNHFGLNFIIETHSEYFIRKLQYLVAKKELKPEQIKIYYFNKPNLKLPKGEKQIRTLDIREDGMMDGDFGPGFFDE